jgi:GMP synthase-like glutamine amidotransferase
MSEEYQYRIQRIIKTDKIKTSTMDDSLKEFTRGWAQTKKQVFAVLQETAAEFTPEDRKVIAQEDRDDVLLIAYFDRKPYELRFHPEFRKMDVWVKTFVPQDRSEVPTTLTWLEKESVQNLCEDFLAAVFGV